MIKKNKKNLIVGVGNILLTDDGIGIHLLRKLKEEESLKGNEFLDLGTSSMDIGYYLESNIARMVIIDCIKSEDNEPGTLFKLGLKDLVSKSRQNFSLHQLKLIDSLKLVSIENDFPETIILGIVPGDTKTFSDRPSKELNDRFPIIYKKVLELIKDFLE
jgi:hydrogenase maturation protease